MHLKLTRFLARALFAQTRIGVRLSGFVLTVLAITLCGASAWADPVSFSSDFSGSVLNANLEDPSSSFTQAGGVISPNRIRKFIRTVDSSYNTVNFGYELTINLSGGGGNGLAFVGYGPGEPNRSFFDEPIGAYMRAGPSDFSALTVTANLGDGDVTENPLGPGGDGTHRIRVTKNSNTLNFDFGGGLHRHIRIGQ